MRSPVRVVMEHPRQDRAVGLVPPADPAPARSPRRARRSRDRPAPACSDRPRSSRDRASSPWFHRRMSSHGTSSSPSMNRSDRTDIGSQYAVNRSTSPRSANPSTSSCASFGIIPCVRSSTSRGRKGASVIRRMRCWSGPSEPSMFVPIVRFRVDGVGRGREHLGRQVHLAHVVVAGHQPQLHGGHPADGLLLPEPCVDPDTGRAPVPPASRSRRGSRIPPNGPRG